MKKLAFFASLLFVIPFFYGCVNVAIPPEITIYGLPSVMDMHEPTAIFMGKDDSGGDPVDVLFEVLADGTVQTVTLKDEYGNALDFQLLNLIRLGEYYVGIIFSYDSTQYKVLARIADGKLLDFSDYDLENATVSGNNLYVISSQTVYRVDLDTEVATPLNNPAFDPVSTGTVFINADYPYKRNYPLVVVNDGNVLADAGDDSSGYGMYEIYADDSPPVLQRDPFDLVSIYMYKLADYGFGGCAIGEDGYLYEFSASYTSDNASAKYLKYNIDSTETTIDSTDLESSIGRVFNFDEAPYDIYDRYRYFVFAGGYYHITPVVDGGFNFSFTSKTIPTPPGSTFYSGTILGTVFSGTAIFSKSGDTIYEMDIVNDTEFSEVVTSSDIIEWWVASGTVFYTAYITATNIGTYKVNDDGSTTLLDNSDMEIRNIIEFSL